MTGVVQFQRSGHVAIITLNRPDRKNPLTFESYAELRDTFRSLVYEEDVRAVVITGAGDNFCSGGDVHEIIGPLTKMSMKELLAFTRMTGDLVKAIRHCPQPVISAIDGVCAGAGAAIAMASDLRYGTRRAKTGGQALRIFGGKQRFVELRRGKATPGILSFWAERWTRRTPFELRVEARQGEDWRLVYRDTGKQVVIGGYHAKVEVTIPFAFDGLRVPEKSLGLLDPLVGGRCRVRESRAGSAQE